MVAVRKHPPPEDVAGSLKQRETRKPSPVGDDVRSLKSKPGNPIGQWQISREGREGGEGSRLIFFAHFASFARPVFKPDHGGRPLGL